MLLASKSKGNDTKERATLGRLFGRILPTIFPPPDHSDIQLWVKADLKSGRYLPIRWVGTRAPSAPGGLNL